MSPEGAWVRRDIASRIASQLLDLGMVGLDGESLGPELRDRAFVVKFARNDTHGIVRVFGPRFIQVRIAFPERVLARVFSREAHAVRFLEIALRDGDIVRALEVPGK